MRRNSSLVVGFFLAVFAVMPVGLVAAEEVTLTGVFQGTEYNTHYHPIAGKVIAEDGKEYQVMDNEVAHELYHVTEGRKIRVTGTISAGPDGKQIELKSITPLE